VIDLTLLNPSAEYQRKMPVGSEQIVITMPMLRHLAMCKRRVWLGQFGDPLPDAGDTSGGAQSVIARATPAIPALYSVKAGELQRVEIMSWAHGVAVSQDLMRQQADTIFDACLEYTMPLDLSDQLYRLQVTVDQLRRVRYQDTAVYSPIVIKQQGQPEETDWLHLDLCAWLLQASQGRVPPAELWLGTSADGQPRQRIVHDYDEGRLMNALTLMAQALDPASEPPIHLLAHCKSCPWYSACQNIARDAGSLDLLYGLSQKTRRNMRQEGLATLVDVAAASVETLRRVKGIGPATAPVLRANAQAWLEDRPVRYNPLPGVGNPHDAWMFDLETLEVNGKTIPWCLGWCDAHGETQIALVAPVSEPEPLVLQDNAIVTLVPDYETAWFVFADALSGGTARIYHWTGYDVGILRSTAPVAARNQLESRMVDLHRLFTRSVSLPAKSTSIKAVSVYLGFPWVGTNDWFEAFLDYRQWIETGNLAALTRACMYQRADVQSMAWVWRWLTGSAPETEY
jgi:predicted RecB family nuclease